MIEVIESPSTQTLEVIKDDGTVKLLEVVARGPQGIAGQAVEPVWGNITGALLDQLDLKTALDGKLSLGGGTMTGNIGFGGITNAFPMLKRNGVGIDIRLADDSAYGTLRANAVEFDVDGRSKLTRNINTDGLDFWGGATRIGGTWNAGILFDATKSVSWSSGAFGTTSPDLYLRRGGAGVLEQYNGANAQAQNVYNTRTDASNYERGVFAWSGGVLNIGAEKAGTGVDRGVVIKSAGVAAVVINTNGSNRWRFDEGGVFHPITDNTNDIGGSANRMRNAYVGTSLVVGGDGTTGNPRGVISWDTNQLMIQSLESGSFRAISFKVGAQSVIAQIDQTGLMFPTDNSYDIGASAAKRPRSIYTSANVFVGSRLELGNNLGLGSGNALFMNSLGMMMSSAMYLAWSSGGNATSGIDTFMYRGIAGRIDQRFGVNAQGQRIYNTYTDASNGEWASLGWQDNANILTLATGANGTGTVRNLRLSAPRIIVNTQSQIFNVADTAGIYFADGDLRFYENSLASSLRLQKSTFSGGQGVKLGANAGLMWATTGDVGIDAVDTGIRRNAAGVVEINNGTAGTLAGLTLASLTTASAKVIIDALAGAGRLTLTRASDGYGWRLTPNSANVLEFRSGSGASDTVYGSLTDAGALSVAANGTFGRYEIDQTYGLRPTSGSGALSIGTSAQLIWAASYGVALNGLVIGTANQDARLSYDGTGTIAQRNAAVAQNWNTYGTYTDASNYRRLRFGSTTAGAFSITAEGLGTGASGNTLTLNGGSGWNIDAAGNALLRAITTNVAAGFSAVPQLTSLVVIGASTTTASHLRLTAGANVAGPVNGDIWFDGTDIKMRIGGVTKTFTLT